MPSACWCEAKPCFCRMPAGVAPQLISLKHGWHGWQACMLRVCARACYAVATPSRQSVPTCTALFASPLRSLCLVLLDGQRRTLARSSGSWAAAAAVPAAAACGWHCSSRGASSGSWACCSNGDSGSAMRQPALVLRQGAAAAAARSAAARTLHPARPAAADPPALALHLPVCPSPCFSAISRHSAKGVLRCPQTEGGAG